MIWPDPTHQPTHPPTHQIIHPPMGGEFSTDFKSSNRIEISWLVQVLLNFYWFRGSPLGGGRWVDGGGGGYGCVGGVPCTHVHLTHAHAHMHTCMHMHVHVKHDKHGCLHVGSHLQFLYMHVAHACTCACMCMCMCVHACVWWHPPCPQMPPDTPHPPAPSPEPQGAQNTKIQ